MPKPAPDSNSKPGKHTLSYQLRQVIESRGQTAYATARASGLDPGVVSRFMTGKRGLTLATADKLAAALGVRLVEIAAKPKPKRRAKARNEPLPI